MATTFVQKASTFVLAAAVSEAGMAEAAVGGGFPAAKGHDVDDSREVRLFVLQRATDTLPRSIDFDRYGYGLRRC